MDQFAIALEHRLRTNMSLFQHGSAACANRMCFLHKRYMLLTESNLVEVYKDSLDVGLNLGNELEHFADFVTAFKVEQAEDVS